LISLAGKIATRYLFSRKNRNAVHVITGIALLGYAVGCFALLTILSALNGFEGLLFDVYNDFHPDLQLSPKQGKVFNLDSAKLRAIRKLPGVQYASPVLEDNAVLQAGNQQVICTLKGVDTAYLQYSGLRKRLIAGTLDLGDPESMPMALLGEGLDYRLNLNHSDHFMRMNAIVPDRTSTSLINPQINDMPLIPAGIFRLDDEIGNRYALVPLHFAEELFGRESEYSLIDIMLEPNTNEQLVAAEIQKIAGDDFDIRDRKNQNQALLKMFRTEKWATFSILCFVLGIVSFNLTGALSMLVIEKKEDIRILHVMGAKRRSIAGIFMLEGIWIALLGALSGVLVSVLAVILQQQFGLIAMNSAIVPHYPVDLRSADILLVLGVALVLGSLSAIYPAWRSVRTR
jgi:lipoprotein-releasing system permease protein